MALYGFAARPGPLTPFIAEPREFHRLQKAAAALDYVPLPAAVKALVRQQWAGIKAGGQPVYASK